jgi:hypothetical protein
MTKIIKFVYLITLFTSLFISVNAGVFGKPFLYLLNFLIYFIQNISFLLVIFVSSLLLLQRAGLTIVGSKQNVTTIFVVHLTFQNAFIINVNVV